MTILHLLMAIVADGVMESVAAARRSYLLQIERYFDQRGLTARSAPRQTSA